MPKVFLSHSSKDKKIVLNIKENLDRSLVHAWLDAEQIPGGSVLTNFISSHISDTPYFFMFVSNHYLKSNWCTEEFNQAYAYLINKQVTIIPILLEDKAALNFDTSNSAHTTIKSLLDRITHVKYDIHDDDKSISGILEAFWKNEDVRFSPIEVIEVQGVRLQRIHFEVTKKTLASDFIKNWRFDITEFIADDSTSPKPIKQHLPVAFYGKAPNWLITYLVIPFKNLRSVYVYNNTSNDYICSYSKGADNILGNVLKVATDTNSN